MFKRILVAIDASEFYQNIFEQALMLAKANQIVFLDVTIRS